MRAFSIGLFGLWLLGCSVRSTNPTRLPEQCTEADGVSSVESGQPDDAPWPPEVATFKQSVIEPVLVALQRRAAGDAILQALIRRLGFRLNNQDDMVVSAFQVHCQSLIGVDLSYLRKVGEDARRAVPELLDATEAGGQDVVYSSRLAEVLSPLASMDIVAWAILHELAHHSLGHLRSNDGSTAVTDERAADEQAFRWMAALKFSPLYLKTYFAYRSKEADEPGGNDHPSYAQRQALLSEIFGALRPDRLNRSLVMAFPNDASSVAVVIITLMMSQPSQPVTTFFSLFTPEGGESLHLASQGPWDDGQQVCVRAPDHSVTRILIAEPHDELPQADLTMWTIEGNQVHLGARFVAVAFPYSIAPAIATASTMASLEERLVSSGASNASATAGAEVVVRHTRARQEFRYHYECDGSIEQAAYLAQVEHEMDLENQELVQTVGAEIAAKFYTNRPLALELTNRHLQGSPPTDEEVRAIFHR